MKLYHTTQGIVLEASEEYFVLRENWDTLTNVKHLHAYLNRQRKESKPTGPVEAQRLISSHLLPPIGSQEVWAAGVTYMQSRDARMEEAKAAGGGDFYDKVYDAERPELFFKSLPHRVAGHGQTVYIREDSEWNVPEPELTLFINTFGAIAGYTVGNDVSSRSIEGENPLYLPQAKVYERSAALGPCLYVPEKPLSVDTTISMAIYRKEEKVFTGSVKTDQMKRSPEELAGYLNRGFHFPHGSFLMTGTCLVPENDFTLMPGDRVEINISSIGKLVNEVAVFKNDQRRP